MDTMLKGNFKPTKNVEPQPQQPDKRAEFEKKALESIGGSMVFVERKRIYFDPEQV
jgi:hypothetical protein